MKFFAVLVAVASVASATYIDGSCASQSVIPTCGDAAPVIAAPVVAAPVVDSGYRASSSSRVYKVALDNCGPRAKPLPPVDARPVSATPIKAKPVVLPYKIPAPKTVSNRCRCEKVVLKPQVVRQLVVVPVIRKYVQTLARPTYETINYAAVPVNCPRVESYGSC